VFYRLFLRFYVLTFTIFLNFCLHHSYGNQPLLRIDYSTPCLTTVPFELDKTVALNSKYYCPTLSVSHSTCCFPKRRPVLSARNCYNARQSYFVSLVFTVSNMKRWSGEWVGEWAVIGCDRDDWSMSSLSVWRPLRSWWEWRAGHVTSRRCRTRAAQRDYTHNTASIARSIARTYM